MDHDVLTHLDLDNNKVKESKSVAHFDDRPALLLIADSMMMPLLKEKFFYSFSVPENERTDLPCNLLGPGASHGRSQAAVELQHGQLVEQLLGRLNVCIYMDHD